MCGDQLVLPRLEGSLVHVGVKSELPPLAALLGGPIGDALRELLPAHVAGEVRHRVEEEFVLGDRPRAFARPRGSGLRRRGGKRGNVQAAREEGEVRRRERQRRDRRKGHATHYLKLKERR